MLALIIAIVYYVRLGNEISAACRFVMREVRKSLMHNLLVSMLKMLGLC
ncbi:hypothetical protein [Ehrlichia minasensis]|nr:hypothetical protein [Ehrlichia minasensis]